MYEIRDEMGGLMRLVGRLEEAKNLIRLRDGWSYKKLPQPRQDLTQFEDALF